jgi:hypothetical protein
MKGLAVTTAGILVVALLAAAASARAAGPIINVSCGQAALVSAIDTANSAGGGRLVLAPGCHYLLTTSPDASENGLPAITSPITIKGNQAKIDGTGSLRVFEVDGPDGSLTLRDLRITGGSADIGGGIANFGGAVALEGCHVNGNTAAVAGGGIASASITPSFDPSSTVATLTVRNSSVSRNAQTEAPSDEDMGGLGGGGILNMDGTARLNHTLVNANTAQGGVGGGIASGDYIGLGGDTSLTVEHSRVNGNVAPNAGGGGVQNLLGSATLYDSQVNGNTALNGGGIASGNAGNPAGTAELKLNGTTVNRNTATAGPGGEGPPIAAAGIANGSDAVIAHSQVNRNTAPNGIGAGIVNHGMMTVSHSTVNHNAATASGVLGSGGGIVNAQGPPGTTPAVLLIDASRVNGNTANGYGGGIANGLPLPGPMPFPGGDLTVKKSQVNRNTAAHGGGIFNTGGTVALLAGTQVVGNQVDNCEPTNSIAGCTN